jgi:Ser/Thr protein kinase RdoA (MazF antagonist)
MVAPRALRHVLRHFRVAGEVREVERFGRGHINDTYRAVLVSGQGATRYILQRINHQVFEDPVAVMSNIQRVTAHLRSPLMPLPAQDGGTLCRDDCGNWWRLYPFIEKTHTCATVASPRQAHQVARAFGQFQAVLADLGPPRLHETIADFHDTPKRFAALEQAVHADTCGRAKLAEREIDFAMRRRSLAPALLSGHLPERIVHNDAKLDNLLIDDRTDEPVCVVDLDTVMPGLAAHDFGDLVRTSTSPAEEDELDLGRVTMRLPMFEALVAGYLDAAGGFLTPAERACLPLAGQLITFEQGLRFLTDFLAGDTYFATHRPSHNLDRCRTQFKLVESIETQAAAMERIVARL